MELLEEAIMKADLIDVLPMLPSWDYFIWSLMDCQTLKLGSLSYIFC